MAAPAPAGGGGNILTEKLGPLATWVWLAIATVLIAIFYLYEKHKQGTSGAAATAAGTTSASQVPDYIVQNYLGNTPTGAPSGSTPPPPPPPTTTTTPPPAARPTSITASGADSGDINQIAKSYGLTEAQLIAANPNLKSLKVKVSGKTVKLYGSGQPIPKGTVVKIPPLPS